jgi:hypothetical protein
MRLTGGDDICVLTDACCKDSNCIRNDPGGFLFPSGSAFFTFPLGIHLMVAWLVMSPSCSEQLTISLRILSPLCRDRTLAAWSVW